MLTAAGSFWRAAWALALGCAVSAAIQVFDSRRAAAERLGDGTPGQPDVAALCGFVSASRSFAALSATPILGRGRCDDLGTGVHVRLDRTSMVLAARCDVGLLPGNPSARA